MKNKTVIWATISLLFLVVFGIYIILENATYLDWGEYKVPEYPVGGSDSVSIYTINSQTILSSLEAGSKSIFTQRPLVVEDSTMIWQYGSLTWKQDDYINIATRFHQFVWGETLEDWLVYNATFYIYNYPKPGGIEYAHLVFYKRQNNEYIVHTITIKPLYNQIIAGSAIYHDEDKWRGFDLNKLAIRNVDDALLIADENGGHELCRDNKSHCSVGIWLDSTLNESNIWGLIPLYTYEWSWNVTYYDESQNHIFDIKIDPFTGKIIE